MDENELEPKNNDPSEEEYHFEDQEVTPPNYSQAAAEKPASASSRPRKILTILGLIVLLFFGYKLWDIFSSRNKVPPVVSRATVPLPAAQTPKPVTPTAPVIPPPTAVVPAELPVTRTERIAEAPSNDRLRMLEEQRANEAKEMEQLRDQMTQVQDMLGNLTTRLTNLGDTVQDLNGKIIAQREVVIPREIPTPIRVKRVRRRVSLLSQQPLIIPQPAYRVKAMIQGRAWLIGPGCRTITVKVGDELPGQGIVQIINPEQGTVTTSLGAIIEFSPYDS